MQLRHTKALDARIDQVWTHFMDLERIGRCFPGANISDVHGGEFTGCVTVKFGPLILSFLGEGSMVEHDASSHTAMIKATGRERHGLGKADITITLHLEELDSGRTHADISTGLDVKGTPTNFGGGVGQRASDPLLERFLTCMAEDDVTTHQGCDEPIDIGRQVLPDLVASYGRSIQAVFRR